MTLPRNPARASVHRLNDWYDACESENAPCSSLYSIFKCVDESSRTTEISFGFDGRSVAV